MTVENLIYELRQMNPNSELRLAEQPSWPFEYSIASIVEVSSEDENDEGFDYDVVESIVYIGEGNQLGYLPDEVKDELGW